MGNYRSLGIRSVMGLEPVLRDHLVMTAAAVIVAVIISVAAWSVLDDDYTAEIVAVVGMAVGMAVGILAMLLVRRRDIFRTRGSSICYKLREVCSVLSFLAVVPTAVFFVITLLHPDSDVSDMPLISAIMVLASMLTQAYYWRVAQNIGSMSGLNVITMVIALILLNVSAILGIDHDSIILAAVSMFTPIAAVLLMYDWAWSADLGFLISLVCTVVATVAIVMDDWMQFGLLLSFWIPTVFLFFDRHSMKNTFLMCDGEKLY